MKNADVKKISRAFGISEEAIKAALKRATAKTEKLNRVDDPKTSPPSYFYFLANDFQELVIRIENLHKEITRLGEAIGRSCDVSGETFHDNFDYEECSRQQAMWSDEIKKLTEIKSRARIVEAQDNGQLSVSVGRTIVIRNNGSLQKIQIGGYMTFSPGSVSYDSALVKLIFGAKIGDVKEGLIGKKKTKIEIMEIL